MKAVDELCGGDRTLRTLELDASSWTAQAVDAVGAFDPEHPVPLEELVAQFEDESQPEPARRGRARLGIAVVVLLLAASALAWKTTPLGDWVSPERLTATLGLFRDSWYGPALGFATFTLACLLLVPVTALTVAAGLAYGPAAGFAVAWIGATMAAALGHLAGRHMWRESVRRLAGDRLNTLSRRLAKRGILASALVRIVPVAPFMVVNLVAGASHVRGRDFVVGTALGILPGTFLLVVAADWTNALFAEPDASRWMWTALSVLALAGTLAAAKRLPWRQRPKTPRQ